MTPLTSLVPCPDDQGLRTVLYSVDFTNVTSLPKEWTIANHETIKYGPAGAEFAFTKRNDAPTIFSNFFFLFGRIEYVVQAAPGQGIVSSMVLLSDDFDEIDWEFIGGNNTSVQTNYFGKGHTGNYDYNKWIPVNRPQMAFHTYAIDWSPEWLNWTIDGIIVRSLKASDADANGYYFPQSPMQIRIGLWDAGDPAKDPATVRWGGGYTILPPSQNYTMYVKSVKIENHNPGAQYHYSDRTGSWRSIKAFNTTANANSSSNAMTGSMASSMSFGSARASSICTSSTTQVRGSKILGKTKAYSRKISATSSTSSSSGTAGAVPYSTTSNYSSLSFSATGSKVTGGIVISPLATEVNSAKQSDSSKDAIIYAVAHATYSATSSADLSAVPATTTAFSTEVSTMVSSSSTILTTIVIESIFTTVKSSPSSQKAYIFPSSAANPINGLPVAPPSVNATGNTPVSILVSTPTATLTTILTSNSVPTTLTTTLLDIHTTNIPAEVAAIWNALSSSLSTFPSSSSPTTPHPQTLTTTTWTTPTSTLTTTFKNSQGILTTSSSIFLPTSTGIRNLTTTTWASATSTVTSIFSGSNGALTTRSSALMTTGTAVASVAGNGSVGTFSGVVAAKNEGGGREVKLAGWMMALLAGFVLVVLHF